VIPSGLSGALRLLATSNTSPLKAQSASESWGLRRRDGKAWSNGDGVATLSILVESPRDRSPDATFGIGGVPTCTLGIRVFLHARR
jgi:hypothetical protein